MILYTSSFISIYILEYNGNIKIANNATRFYTKLIKTSFVFPFLFEKVSVFKLYTFNIWQVTCNFVTEHLFHQFKLKCLMELNTKNLNKKAITYMYTKWSFHKYLHKGKNGESLKLKTATGVIILSWDIFVSHHKSF